MEELTNLNLSTRITNALIKGGVDSITQISKMSESELLEIKGISKKGVSEILDSIEKIKTVSNKSDFSIYNTYVFTKKKYLNKEGRKKYSENRDWVNKLNGIEVIDGFINNTEISKEWCIVK